MSHPRHTLGLAIILCLSSAASPQEKPVTPPRRNLQVDDLFRIRTVAEPHLSHDGRWVAYTVRTLSLKDDKSETQVWMAPADGGDPLAMTGQGTSVSWPRFS